MRLAIIVVTWLLIASPAEATVTAELVQASGPSDTFRVTGDDAASDVSLVIRRDALTLSGDEVTAGEGCAQPDERTVTCPADIGDAYMGAGDDAVAVDIQPLGYVHVYGEAGRDTISLRGEATADGGPGRDRLHGDRVGGGLGRDVLIGTRGDDALRGGFGADRLVGLEGDDSLNGGPGHDRLVGGPGRDGLSGTTGDVLLAGAGDDELGGFGAGRVDCGPGHDFFGQIDFAAPLLDSCERFNFVNGTADVAPLLGREPAVIIRTADDPVFVRCHGHVDVRVGNGPRRHAEFVAREGGRTTVGMHLRARERGRLRRGAEVTITAFSRFDRVSYPDGSSQYDNGAGGTWTTRLTP
jgi:hypothetical protein